MKNYNDINNFGFNDEEVKHISKKDRLVGQFLEEYLSPQEKKELQEQACHELGISSRTLRRYIHNLRENGIESLTRKKRSDKGKYRVFPDGLIDKIVNLLEQNPWRSVPWVKRILEADDKWGPLIKPVPYSTIYYHLDIYGYDLKRRHIKNDGKAYHRFASPYAMHLVQGDARHGIMLPNPDNPKKKKKTYLFGWVDHYSRMILYAKYYWDEKLPRLEDSLKNMVLRWGCPVRGYFDNGKVYVSNNFAFQLNELGIKKIHHPPYKAWCKGQVELVMKIILSFQREAEQADFRTIEELNETLWAWIDVEYNSKIHKETGETPKDRFRNSVIKHPPSRVRDLQWFNALFLSREGRVIDKFKKISFNANEYKIEGLPIGEHIEIRYDPFDLKEIQVFKDEKYYCNLTAHKLTRKTLIKIPEENKKSKAVVSKEAQTYFSKLREKHQESKLKESNSVYLSKQNNKIKE